MPVPQGRNLIPHQPVHSGRRDALLNRIVSITAADERFTAGWLTGSLGRGDGDAFSDLDITLAVAAPAGASLCARPWLVGGRTTPERLALFSLFGAPAVIYENHHNAPDNGTQTSVLYETSAVMVDWTLTPEVTATRPSSSRILFEKASVPVSAAAQPEVMAQRLQTAADTAAFFWMMTAVTAKHVARRDTVFVQCWIERLCNLVREVEGLVAGDVPSHRSGSLAPLVTTPNDQIRVIRELSDRMEQLTVEATRLGGGAALSPRPTIEALLSLGNVLSGPSPIGPVIPDPSTER